MDTKILQVQSCDFDQPEQCREPAIYVVTCPRGVIRACQTHVHALMRTWTRADRPAGEYVAEESAELAPRVGRLGPAGKEVLFSLEVQARPTGYALGRWDGGGFLQILEVRTAREALEIRLAIAEAAEKFSHLRSGLVELRSPLSTLATVIRPSEVSHVDVLGRGRITVHTRSGAAIDAASDDDGAELLDAVAARERLGP